MFLIYKRRELYMVLVLRMRTALFFFEVIGFPYRYHAIAWFDYLYVNVYVPTLHNTSIIYSKKDHMEVYFGKYR